MTRLADVAVDDNCTQLPAVTWYEATEPVTVSLAVCPTAGNAMTPVWLPFTQLAVQDIVGVGKVMQHSEGDFAAVHAARGTPRTNTVAKSLVRFFIRFIPQNSTPIRLQFQFRRPNRIRRWQNIQCCPV